MTFNQCDGTTKQKERCRRTAMRNEKFCSTHITQAPEASSQPSSSRPAKPATPAPEVHHPARVSKSRKGKGVPANDLPNRSKKLCSGRTSRGTDCHRLAIANTNYCQYHQPAGPSRQNNARSVSFSSPAPQASRSSVRSSVRSKSSSKSSAFSSNHPPSVKYLAYYTVEQLHGEVMRRIPEHSRQASVFEGSDADNRSSSQEEDGDGAYVSF
ncbi:hypothetical protein UCRNP2_4351 [Neofusicoccum parvum UCRNP2]|uniref:Uncharacterized protein n=1 Tax=Botryosphaeria parva (strain UCR-NP2) TaxID=1287680 RepID=R1GS70_BOTPV|nr:hypothetical protein UCRNP2_4351 [Neofusicoccum parvum UCRNP2]